MNMTIDTTAAIFALCTNPKATVTIFGPEDQRAQVKELLAKALADLGKIEQLSRVQEVGGTQAELCTAVEGHTVRASLVPGAQPAQATNPIVVAANTVVQRSSLIGGVAKFVLATWFLTAFINLGQEATAGYVLAHGMEAQAQMAKTREMMLKLWGDRAARRLEAERASTEATNNK